MKEDSAIILEDFLSENWASFENFCEQTEGDAESILEEVQAETGQY